MRALGGRLLRFVLLRDNRARHFLDAGDHHRLEHLPKPVHSMYGWSGGPPTHLVRSRVRSRAISRLCISKSAKSARADRGGETRSSHDEATAMSRSFTLLFGVVSIAPVASAYVSHGQANATTTNTKTNTNKTITTNTTTTTTTTLSIAPRTLSTSTARCRSAIRAVSSTTEM